MLRTRWIASPARRAWRVISSTISIALVTLCGVTPQQRCGTLGVGGNGRKRLIQFMGKTRGEFAQQAPIGDSHHLLKHAVHLRTGPAQLMIVVLHDRPILNRPRALLSKGLPL